MAQFILSRNEKITLLKIARNTLKSLLNFSNLESVEARLITPNLKQCCGVFVSIYNKGKLRGCIGQFNPQNMLYKSITEVTRSAALNDYRFSKLEPKEIEFLSIEVSVLTPMEKIETPDEIELGKHGVYIKKGTNSGTFLPQVAKKTKWSKEDFLGHCSRDKAGIGWNGWRDAVLFRYEAIIFNESDFMI